MVNAADMDAYILRSAVDRNQNRSLGPTAGARPFAARKALEVGTDGQAIGIAATDLGARPGLCGATGIRQSREAEAREARTAFAIARATGDCGLERAFTRVQSAEHQET